jgi:hypothetical protein
MKTVTFTEKNNKRGYWCDTSGPMAGEYVPADVAREMIDALKDGITLDLLTDPNEVRAVVAKMMRAIHSAEGVK